MALTDRLVASDPGLVRLYMATRVTASVGSALGIMLLLRGAFHFGLSTALVGVPLGMVAINAVNDPVRRDQKVTTLLLYLPAVASVTIATLAAPYRFLSDALFVAVLFGATYARRYGPRGNALGIVFFIGCFFALVFQINIHDFPWAYLSIAVTIGCTYLFRFVVFADNPKLALRAAAAAFRARERRIESIVAGTARSRWTRRFRNELDRQLFRLNETALMLNDILVTAADRAHVLEAELAVDELVDRARTTSAVPAPVQPLALRADTQVNADWTPRGPFRVGTQIQAGRISQTLRQAIQLSAAGVLAIVLGEIVSAQRWYWAVLTAFFVFVGTSSSQETRARAWSRTVGTAIGVVAGMLLSYPVNGHDVAAFIILIAALFATVYSLRSSFAVFTFFITIVIAMLYVLLGMFSAQLLTTRLVETALGAILGGGAAALLLPVSTGRVLFNVTIEALRRLDEAVQAAVNSLAGDTRADPIQAARTFDEALQSARVQIEPLLSRVGGDRANQHYRMRMLLVTACRHYLHELVMLAYERASADGVLSLRLQGARISADIQAILEYNKSGAPLHLPEGDPVYHDGKAFTYLHSLDLALHGFARTLG